MTMLLSDYCFEINTHGIKKKEKELSNTGLIAAVLHSPRMDFYEDYAEDLRPSRRQN